MNRINKISALFDIMVLLPFSIPIINGYMFDGLGILHKSLRLPGVFIEFEHVHLLFASLLSIVSIMWGVVRYTNPSFSNLVSDTVVRYLIAFVILYYVTFLNVSLLFVAFIISESLFAIIQSRIVWHEIKK